MKHQIAIPSIAVVLLSIGLFASFAESGKPMDGSVNRAAASKTDLKVGYVDMNDLFIQSGEPKSGTLNITGGFGYGLLNALSSYTGWTYSYIDGTWQEQVQRLANDEIDLLLPTNYSAERSESFSFARSVSILNDFAAVYASNSATSLYYDDDDSLRAIESFGLIEGNYLNDEFFSQMTAKGISVTGKVSYYESNDTLATGLANGEVEAMVSGSLFFKDDVKMIDQITVIPAYIAAKDDALAAQVDSALLKLNSEKPEFIGDLYNSYYGRYKTKKGLTKAESEFVSASQGKTFSVVGDSSLFPFEYSEDGSTYHGAYPDIVSLIKDESGLDISFKSTGSMKESWEQISEGKADFISGAYIDGNITKEYNVLSTTSFYDEESTLIMRRSNVESPYNNLNVGVVNGLIGTSYYLKSFFPNWNVTFVDDIDAGVTALEDSSIDALLVNTVILNYLKIITNHDSLVSVPDFCVALPVCLGVSATTDQAVLLQGLISKCVDNISSEQISLCIINNTTSISLPLTAEELFAAQAPLWITLICVVAFLLIVLGIFLTALIGQRRNSGKLATKNAELQSALEKFKEANQTINEAQCGIVKVSYSLQEASANLTILSHNDTASKILSFDLSRGPLDLETAEIFGNCKENGKRIIEFVKGLTPEGGAKRIELQIGSGDEIRTVDCIGIIVKKDGESEERTVQLTLFDVSEHFEKEKSLLSASEKDLLTGLFNKTTAEEKEREYLARPDFQAAVMLISDIDKFKEINDTKGHPVGDEVLVSLAAYLSSIVPGSSIVGRIGGDEFSVLLTEHIDRKNLERIGKCLCSFGSNYKIPFTCSVGLKIIKKPSPGFDIAYSTADETLYKAKKLGGGHYVID